MPQGTTTGSHTVIAEFMSGGGEMGQLMRDHDWAASPVGPVATWPQSLRTTLSIVLNSKYPMFLYWGEEHVQFYNDAYRPSLGKDGKHPAALGQKAKDCWPEIWSVIKPMIDLVLEQGEATFNENQPIPIYRNGRLEDVYWTFSYSPVRGETGQVEGVLAICHETTQQVSNLHNLKISDQRFQNLVRETTVGIIVLEGEEMIIKVVNDAYGRLIDREGSEMLGRPLFSIIPEAIDPFGPLLDKVRMTGQPLYLFDQPYQVYTNGKKIAGFLDVIYQPYKEADGAITGVMAICHDVTEKVQHRKKIEEAEAKARLAIESADQGSYEINLVTDEMITSDRFNIIWGITPPISRGGFASLIHPNDRIMREAAHEQSVRTGNLHYEARLLKDDQSVSWVRVKGKVLYDPAGKPTILLGIIQDITEQKLFAEQLTRQVQERTIELQRSNEDLLQFAHVTSHDLKEPVRKIKIFSNRLQHELGDGLPEKGRIYLEKIQNAADRMVSMIEGVLTYSTVTTSEQSIGPVDLNGVIENIETDLEELIRQKNAIIQKDTLPAIEGAGVLIYQLFYNLINNSLKFSRKEETPVISISSSETAQGGVRMAKICISDNGIGFSGEHAGKIFEAFVRLNSKDKFEGTGLGLSLCRKIVERHGGSITAESVKNAGAVFTVLLPLTQIKVFV